MLPCYIDNEYQNAGQLFWILNNTNFDESETGSPYGQILTEGWSIMDHDLEDRFFLRKRETQNIYILHEDYLDLDLGIYGKAKVIYSG